MMDLIGTRLSEFEIVRELGRGGMGIVYEAVQTSLGRRVALKVLGPGLGLTPRAVDRFRREAAAAAKLHHTNIVPVYATGEANDTHFYAMELIDGPSLDHVIRQMRATGNAAARPTSPTDGESGSLDLAQTGPYVAGTNNAGASSGLSSSSLGSGSGYYDSVARMIAEVADALDYAHQQGVIHRDIKPSNLLLSQTSRLSVNDFGLARMLEQPGMTVTGEFVGTPAYMSPEQITAGRIPLDHRTDIYSLGATLYELLTLLPPFAGASREQVLAQIVQKEPKAPRKIRKNIPVDLETICLKCLEKDPDRRYQTAGALAEDLRRYVNRFAISARRAGPITKLKKWAKRNPALAAACLVALLALAMTALFAYRSYRSEQERIAQQERHERELRIERQERAFDEAMTEALSGDPKRAEKAFRAAESADVSVEQIRLLRGLVALQRGDITDAIPNLELAVERMPDSYAAKRLLLIAYAYAGRKKDGERLIAELKQLGPSKAEDYFLKAWFAGDRAEALKDLDVAISKRDSLIARTFRAQTRCLFAYNESNLKQMEKALQEIEPIRLLLPDNPLVISTSLRIFLDLGIMYGENGDKERRQLFYNRAKEDAQSLQQFEQMPHLAVYILTQYYRFVGENAKQFELIRREAEKSAGNAIYTNYYAMLLYERGDHRKAQKILDAIFVKELKTFLLAETVGVAEAYKACEKIESYDDDIPGKFVSMLFLGRGNEARTVLRELREAGKIKKPNTANDVKAQEATLAYYCDEISEKEYLRAIPDTRWDRSRAEWYIGMTHLSIGDRTGAREHLQKSLDIFPLDETNLSRGILAHIERDPNWPLWIAVKK